MTRHRATWLRCAVVLWWAATGTLAAVEVPGQWGELGKTYALGRAGSRLQFRLTELAYRIEPLAIGSKLYYPKAAEKLLYIRYTIQNAENGDRNLSGSSFELQVVDATNTMCRAAGEAGLVNDGSAFNMRLKPAQRVEVYKLVSVAAKGPAQKLIFQRGDPPVVRFDLAKVKPKPLPERFADPDDKTGSTPLDPLPGRLGEWLPTGLLDLRVDSLAAGVGKVLGKPPAAGRQFVLVTATVRNASPGERTVSATAFRTELPTADGEQTRWIRQLLHATRDETLNSMRLRAHAEQTFRWVFEAPTDATFATLNALAGGSEKRTVHELTAP